MITFTRPNTKLFIILAILVLLAVAIPLGRSGVIGNHAHSVAKHGADAAAIHTALDCNGPSSVWQSQSWRQQNKFFQTCQLDDGRWGCRIVRVGKNAIHEHTSFVPGDGSSISLIEYLSARATCVWVGE